MKNRSAELESKLKSEAESRQSLERKVREYEVEMEKAKIMKIEHSQSLTLLQKESELLSEEVDRRDKENEGLSKQLEEKEEHLVEAEEEMKRLMEQMKVYRERENKLIDDKNVLEDELLRIKSDVEDYHSSRVEEEEEIQLQLEEAERIKQSERETEEIYKQQISELISKYTAIIGEHKAEIHGLQQVIVQLKNEFKKQPAKIELSPNPRKLEEENLKLKQTVAELKKRRNQEEARN